MKKLFKYFLRRRRRLFRVPRQYIAEYQVESATREQLRLMEYGKARTPAEAQRLLQKYKTKYAAVVIDLMPVRKRTLKQIVYDRLRTLVNRIEGSSRYNPVYRRSDALDYDKIQIEYRYTRED